MEYDSECFVEAADGTRLFVETLGTGTPAIILIDGIGCEGFAWRYLRPRLAARHRVVHSHFRGHGRSGPPVDRDQLSIEDLARDLRDVCDHLGIESAVLAAHSMGVQVALELYRQHPDRVVGLVLMCGTFGRITTTFHGTDLLDQVLPSLVRAAQSFPGMARAVWGRIPAAIAFRVACAGRELDAERIQEEDFQRYWEHAALMDPDIFLRMLQLAGEHDARGFLEEVRAPTLVIAAEHDTFTPMALAEEMAGAIPYAELEVIPEASHAAPVEQPDRIAERIEEFVSSRLEITADP
ncbi:MAG: alpha/beta hydrolase [Myxococcales bacterium]|nr:alpha/beta hydrolase [Myxococcales bacterium]MDH3484677.1 alpha/beta hydrolase [Myxococcales bacterium]